VRGECFKLHNRCDKRAKEGKCYREKIGGKSLWYGYTEMPEMNGEGLPRGAGAMTETMTIRIYQHNKLITINGVPVNDGGERATHGGQPGPKYDQEKALRKVLAAIRKELL